MILAEVGSTPYKIVLILHILFVVVAFGGLFAAPMMGRIEGAGRAVAGAMVSYVQRVAVPALVIAGLLGFALVGMSDKAFKFSQTWVGIAIVIWLAEIAVLYLGIVTTERKVVEGDDDARAKLPMYTGLSHLFLVVLVYLMVFKPSF